MKLGKKLILALAGLACALLLLYSHQAFAEMKSKYDFISTGTSPDYPRCSCDTTDQSLDCAQGIMDAQGFYANSQETVSRCSDMFTVTKNGSSVKRYKIYGYAGQVEAGQRVQLTDVGESSLKLKSAGYTNGGLFCLNNKCVLNWGSTPLASTAGGAYQGCYTDNLYSRALNASGNNQPLDNAKQDYTIEECIALGRSRGLRYVGLQWGGQCFGGNDKSYNVVSDSECNMACTRDAKHKCGGGLRNSIYATSDTGKGRFCIGGKCVLSIPKEPQIITDLQVDNPTYTTEIIPELRGRYKYVKPGETYKLTWSVRNAAKLILREGNNTHDITQWQYEGSWSIRANEGNYSYELKYQIEAYGPGDVLVEKGKLLGIKVDWTPDIYEKEFRSKTSNRSAYIAFKKFDIAAIKIFYQSDVNNPISWYGCSIFNGSCSLLDSERQEYHLDAPRKYRIIVYNAFGGKSPPYDFILQREHEYSPIRENNGNFKLIGYSDAKKESPWCHSEPERKSGFVCEGDWEGRCYDGWAYNKGFAGYGGWGYGQWVYCYNNLNPE